MIETVEVLFTRVVMNGLSAQVCYVNDFVFFQWALRTFILVLLDVIFVNTKIARQHLNLFAHSKSCLESFFMKNQFVVKNTCKYILCALLQIVIIVDFFYPLFIISLLLKWRVWNKWYSNSKQYNWDHSEIRAKTVRLS